MGVRHPPLDTFRHPSETRVMERCATLHATKAASRWDLYLHSAMLTASVLESRKGWTPAFALPDYIEDRSSASGELGETELGLMAAKLPPNVSTISNYSIY